MKIYETPPRLIDPSDTAKYFRQAATRHFSEAARLFSRASVFYLLYFQIASIRMGSRVMTILRCLVGFQRQKEIVACEPPLEKRFEKIDNQLHEHRNDKKDEH